MRKKYILLFFMLIPRLLFALQCEDFATFKEHGGHWYVITSNKMTFPQAKQIAENNGGYLAIPNNASENMFLAKTFGTAWIGIHDPNFTQSLCIRGTQCSPTAHRFRTVKGEVPSFSNWSPGEPSNSVYEYDIINNRALVAPLGEHWAAIGPNGEWGDFGNHAEENNNPIRFKAIFEFDSKPSCLEGDTSPELLEERKCTEAIYNTGTIAQGTFIPDDGDSAAITQGNTYVCQRDQFKNEYCPAQVAPCGEQWSYDNGYSTAHQICPDKTEPSNNACSTTTKACPPETYVSGNKCVSDNYLEPTIQPTTVQRAWWRCNSCMGTFLSGSDGNNAMSFWDSFKNIATQAGATSFYYSENNNGCNANNCIYVEGYYFYHNAPIPVTFYSSGGSKPVYYIQASITKCRNLVYVPAQYKINAHYKCMDNTPLICPAGYFLTPESWGGYSCKRSTSTTYACPSQYSQVTPDGYCYSQPMTYYTYHCKNETNTFGESWTAINPGGTTSTNSSPPPNNCKMKGFVCQAAADRPCAFVDNQWQCSPFPCFGDSDIEDADTTMGRNDTNNKGFNDDGSCSGQIRLFNGKDMRCRSKDKLFGAMGGGCCKRGKPGGIGNLFTKCNETETLLSKYRKESSDKSHEVGEYCSKRIKLGFAKICIQNKKTFCVFNSKLGRIIQEQGRPQLGIGWGEPKSPNCSGFTPEQFQKIDFSKLDLSEFYGDIEKKVQAKINARFDQTIQQKLNSFSSNLNGGKP